MRIQLPKLLLLVALTLRHRRRRLTRRLPEVAVLAHGSIGVGIFLLHGPAILIVREALIVVLRLHLDDAINALLRLPEALPFAQARQPVATAVFIPASAILVSICVPVVVVWLAVHLLILGTLTIVELTLMVLVSAARLAPLSHFEIPRK